MTKLLKPIRVVVTEDSAVTRALLTAILEEAPEFEVVAAVSDGAAAVDAVGRLRPSVVTMDLHMPRLDGVEATRRIMREVPTPIVVVTASSEVDGRMTYDALAAGALSVVARPVGPSDPRFAPRRAQLLAELRLMAGVSVVRRFEQTQPPTSAPLREPRQPVRPIRVIAIAASTGGPAALHRILGDLPRDFDVPIVVVQHMSEGFIGGLARWLSDAAPGAVSIARDGDPLTAGNVLLAPDGAHLRVAADGTVRLRAGSPVGGHRPAATVLFDTVADVYGAEAIGIILTGMGRDGADGLARLRATGAVTLAQDAASSAVFGMPRAALEAGAVERVVSLENLGSTIAALVIAGLDRRQGHPR
ncbi:MAG: chemotaxis-specific protein-glutamate methyltransferase CheB [Chloroflexota bacterium]